MTEQDWDSSGGESGYCQPCQVAVQRTYRDLRAKGMGDRLAFDAAVRVCAIRHPERDFWDCVDTVAAWLDEGGESLH